MKRKYHVVNSSSKGAARTIQNFCQASCLVRHICRRWNPGARSHLRRGGPESGSADPPRACSSAERLHRPIQTTEDFPNGNQAKSALENPSELGL